MNNKNTWIALIVLIVIVLVAGFLLNHFTVNTNQSIPQTPTTTDTDNTNGTFVASASYRCDNSKTVQAAFYQGADATTTVVAGQPPVPTGVALVVLSDGKTYRLGQTISADGGRYSNPDGSLVFWDKGNKVVVLENNQQVNYTNCVKVTE